MIKKAILIAGAAGAVGLGYLILKKQKISNSLGHFYNPIPENIQLAIDDLDGEPGWVRLPRRESFTMSYPTVVPSNFTLYGNKSTLRLDDNCNCNVIVNQNQGTGDTNISILDLIVNGRALRQSAPWMQHSDPVSCRQSPDYFMWNPPCKHPGNTTCIGENRYICNAEYLWDLDMPNAPECSLEDMNGHCVENHPQHAIHGLFFKKVSNSRIINCDFLHCISAGVYWWLGSGNLIRDSRFAYSGEQLEGSGTIDNMHYGLYCENTDGITILDSDFHDNYADGFAIEDHWRPERDPNTFPRDWLVENCRAWNNLAGFWFENARYGTIRNCESFNNYKSEAYEIFEPSGFVIGMNSHYIDFWNCYSHHAKWRGFSCEGWHHIAFNDCIAHNIGGDGPWAGAGIAFGARNTTIDHSIPLGNHSAIGCEIWDIFNGTGIYYYAYNPTLLYNIINNVGTEYAIYMGANNPSGNPNGECAYNIMTP